MNEPIHLMNLMFDKCDVFSLRFGSLELCFHAGHASEVRINRSLLCVCENHATNMSFHLTDDIFFY